MHLPLSDVLAIVIDSFTSATERHIEVRPASLLFPPLPFSPAPPRDAPSRLVVATPDPAALTSTPQVGDGLEIYVVVAQGRSPQGLEGMRNVQEVSPRADGDRMFVLRRELKKD